MFFEDLTSINTQLKNQICIGIDPHVSNLPTFFKHELSKSPKLFLKNFSQCLIDATNNRSGSVKFQSSFFEAFGHDGVITLKESISYAKNRGLLTILDVKRGDISSTMKAYGTMAFDYMGADAMTVLPYMGVETIQALSDWIERGKGIYMVWVSSNPSGTLIQAPIAELIIDQLKELPLTNSVIPSVGLVLGATKIETFDPMLLEKVEKFPLLMPGVGAQGAELSTVCKSLLKKNQSSLLPISRGISGLGLSSESITLEKVDSWVDYSQYLAKKIEHFLELLK